MMNIIEIITTGGTIDKTYNPISGKLGFEKSYIDEIIKNANLTIDIKINHLMQKDSLDIDDIDRDLIFTAVQNSKMQKIILTHGTDTMAKTAKTLAKITDKVIVLTGAMIPYSISKTDSPFNLGFAIASVSNLKNGVYIAINGKIFNAKNVIKDTKLGVFKNS